MKKVFILVCFLMLIQLTFVGQDKNWQEFYNRSFDYFYNGEYEKAIECLKEALEADSTQPMIYWRLTYVFQSKIENEGVGSKKELKELKAMFNELFNKGLALCETNSTEPEILFYLGGLYGNRVFFKQAAGQRNISILRDTEASQKFLSKIKKTDNFYYEACGYLGIFNYYPVLMSGPQAFIVKRAGYKWNEDEGLRQIKESIEYSRYSDDIKLLYKGISISLVKKKEYRDRIREVIDLVEGLIGKYPRNQLLQKDLDNLNELLKTKK